MDGSKGADVDWELAFLWHLGATHEHGKYANVRILQSNGNLLSQRIGWVVQSARPLVISSIEPLWAYYDNANSRGGERGVQRGAPRFAWGDRLECQKNLPRKFLIQLFLETRCPDVSVFASVAYEDSV